LNTRGADALTVSPSSDYFEFLGLPRKLNFAPAVLEKRFRELSRQFHPDYFQNASPDDRRASLLRSSYLNDAYRTLRDPVARVSYLLRLEGLAPEGSHELSRQVPPELLEEVFALNEQLDEARNLRAGGAPEREWHARLEAARRPIDAKRADHEAQLRELAARWDDLVDACGTDAPRQRRAVLEALSARLLERNYIANLLAGVERELGEP
jgi:molecular chaperone HscB